MIKTMLMKTNSLSGIINRIKEKKGTSFALFIVLLGFFIMIPSCTDDEIWEGSYYTFTGDRLGEYLQEHPEQFSEWVQH